MLKTQLDLYGRVDRAGFRLDRLEVYNWGTFHKHVWCLSAACGQNLLTGDVGSGKSSLVDALTTLLVPPHRITFNKAAGAEKQERSLYTYVRGAYGNEQDPESNSSRLLTLRDASAYSVLLAVFLNESTQRTITLAQVFRLRKNEKNPDRFYVMAGGALSIEKDFFNVKKDISDIRASLKKRVGCEIFDSFKEYAGRFRQEFGIKSEQALELFYQAVSMKTVGSLTDFVRQHMLEKTDVETQIEELCASFEDLRGAHDAILRARHQIGLLQPIAELGDKFIQDQDAQENHTQIRNLLGPYFAAKEVSLFDDSLRRLNERKEKNGQRSEKLALELAEERQNHFDLQVALQNKGGGRIQNLEAEIVQKETEKKRRVQQELRYQLHCRVLDLTPPKSMESFFEQRQRAATLKSGLQIEKTGLDNQFVDLKVNISQLQKKEQELNEEIESLKRRQSNIPVANLRLREEMTRVLDLNESDLPFAGELLQVKTEEKKWQGAIERVLRNMGLSLLVSEAHYPAVSRYVNETHLRGKLVYLRVQAERKPFVKLSADSLPAKIEIRRDSIFFDWVRQELEIYFNFECCDNLEDFQRYPKALSLTGQMKVSAKKHEKDDRFLLNDRSRFVLGWSNKDKLQSLRDDLAELQRQGQTLFDQVAKVEAARVRLDGRLTACEGLLHFQAFEEIHWQELAEAILGLEQEILKIRRDSDILDTLQGLIQEAVVKIGKLDGRMKELQKEDGYLTSEIATQTSNRDRVHESAVTVGSEVVPIFYPQIERLGVELDLWTDLSLTNITKRQTQAREFVQGKLDALVKSLGYRREKITAGITDFLHHYREFTVQLDASVESLPELRVILNQLTAEDLPRHEARFFKKLKEDTINGMAMFQELLDKERRGIENKIQLINDCLHGIDYNPGTYIGLLLNKNVDQEVAHFRHDLRLILSNTTGPDNVYTEQKFMEVKGIIDRLKGRAQFLDADKKWTAKVTDVRNWFTFAASERYKSDNTEKEYYPDSGGKSGGQKEKLAYTVLASALAYQYGIEAAQDTPKSFRFVMIDEAFGRGSDESARYGLTLFEKLNLQLLVVTPLQKIHVIEDYVDYVHLAHNEASKNSRLHSLTIEQFKKERLEAIARGKGLIQETI